MQEFDLDKLKEQAKMITEDGRIIEARLLNEDLTYFSMFVNGLMGFMMGKKSPKSGKYNFFIKGEQEEVEALKSALLNNKILMKKIENGTISKSEMDRLLHQADISKKRFTQLTGITLPF